MSRPEPVRGFCLLRQRIAVVILTNLLCKTYKQQYYNFQRCVTHTQFVGLLFNSIYILTTRPSCNFLLGLLLVRPITFRARSRIALCAKLSTKKILGVSEKHSSPVLKTSMIIGLFHLNQLQANDQFMWFDFVCDVFFNATDHLSKYAYAYR